jgi:hypothetical protein
MVRRPVRQVGLPFGLAGVGVVERVGISSGLRPGFLLFPPPRFRMKDMMMMEVVKRGRVEALQ